MTQAQHSYALHFLADRPLTPFSTLALRVVVMIVTWEERRRTRKHLDRLSAHQLQDIGITPQDARREARKPFWLM